MDEDPKDVARRIFSDAANFFAESQKKPILCRGLDELERILSEEGFVSDEVREGLTLIRNVAIQTEDGFQQFVLEQPRRFVKSAQDARTIAELRSVISLVRNDIDDVIRQGQIVAECDEVLAEATKANEEYPELKLLEEPENTYYYLADKRE
jgi:hypothetical protein